MKTITPYLFFNGNCKAAMEFYRDALGGELRIVTAGSTGEAMFKDLDPDLVMHAHLQAGPIVIMASDNMKRDTDFGDNNSIFLDCSSRAEADKIYAALSKGGDAEMKPQDQFWGAYMGSLVDPFKVGWMINVQETRGSN
jgi:PhnB protein